MKKAFTLVELLVVISILAILYALAVPAFIATRAAAQGYMASNSLSQLGTGMSLYTSDSDDNAPLAMYSQPDGTLEAWFGTGKIGTTFDRTQGVLSSYMKSKLNSDPTFNASPYIGDGSGYGYNWGYIGSDFNMQPYYLDFPNCRNAASMSQLATPSSTIVFATSSLFSAPWSGGDGKYYDFGLIDPPHLWNGNPNVDFRHQGTKTIDLVGHKVTSTGHAIVVRADGSVKTRHMGQITDADFVRS